MKERIRQQVLSLALPVIVSSLLQRSVGIVDIFLVGGLGADSIAAVGIGQMLVFIAMSLSWGVNVGATVLVSQFWGAGKRREAGWAAFQALLIALVVAAVLTFAGLAFYDGTAALLGATETVRGLLADYAAIIFSCIIFTIFINVLSGIMHGTGDTRTPLAATLIVNIVHVLLAYPLVYGAWGMPDLGVRGAAIAVAVSESLGAGFLLVRSIGREAVLPSRHYEHRYTATMYRIGAPIVVDRLLQNTGSLLFAKVVLLYGTTIYAAHQVGLAVEAFSFMPGYGIAVAAATMVGQSLGAGRPDEAKLSSAEANRLAVMLMAGMGILFFFFPYLLLRLFTTDPEVIRSGILYMKIVAFAQVPLAVSMVMSGTLRGAGETGFIMFATIAGMWVVRLPLAALLSLVLKADIRWVWSVMIVDWFVRMGLLMWRSRRQAWSRIDI